MAVKRQNAVYLMHPVFCLYVSFEIIVQMIMKILGKTPQFRSYDGKEIIARK